MRLFRIGFLAQPKRKEKKSKTRKERNLFLCIDNTTSRRRVATSHKSSSVSASSLLLRCLNAFRIDTKTVDVSLRILVLPTRPILRWQTALALSIYLLLPQTRISPCHSFVCALVLSLLYSKPVPLQQLWLGHLVLQKI